MCPTNMAMGWASFVLEISAEGIPNRRHHKVQVMLASVVVCDMHHFKSRATTMSLSSSLPGKLRRVLASLALAGIQLVPEPEACHL